MKFINKALIFILLAFFDTKFIQAQENEYRKEEGGLLGGRI